MATSTPDIKEYLDAAFIASSDTSIDSDINPLMDSRGQVFQQTITKDGFFAEAFLTPEHQLIVAYAGTEFENLLKISKTQFVVNQIADDQQIFLGKNPNAFADGVAFLQQAEAAATDAGLSIAAGNVFVDGHSLGGAIAAYVAAQENLPGTTFAAPGLAPGDIPPGADSSNVTAYVEYGDTIGNYGGSPDVEGTFPHEGITRYGTTKYLGSSSDADELTKAADDYAKFKLVGLFDFANAAAKHHALVNYSSDLIGEPSKDSASDTAGTTEQYIAAVQQAIAQGNPATLSVSIDSKVSFTDPTTAVLTGTASSPAVVKSVEITAQVDGVETDLGAATVNSDGTFSFTDAVGSHRQTDVTATAMDTAGNHVSQTSQFSLQNGQESGVYGASSGQNVTDTWIKVSGPGQTFTSSKYDIFANQHQDSTTFVFSPGFGLDVIRGFTAAGSGRDLLALPHSDFQNLAAVFRNTGDVNGSAFITDPKTGDAIRLAGVTTAELKANPKDIVLF